MGYRIVLRNSNQKMVELDFDMLFETESRKSYENTSQYFKTKAEAVSWHSMLGRPLVFDKNLCFVPYAKNRDIVQKTEGFLLPKYATNTHSNVFKSNRPRVKVL